MPLARRIAPPVLAAPAVVAALIAGGPARAAEPLSLAWSAPSGCPSLEDVLTETRRLLGGADTDAPLTARAAVDLPAPSDYRLRISIDRASEERPREIHAPTCAELGDAAALILALAIDPVAVAATPSRSSPQSAAAPPPPPAPRPLPAPTGDSDSPILGPDVPGPRVASPDVPGPRVAGPGVLGPDAPGPRPAAPLDVALRSAVPAFALPVFKLALDPRPPIEAPPSPVRLHLALGAEAGTFRDLSPVLRAGVSVAPSPLRFDAGLVGVWGGKISAPDTPEKGGEMWLGGGVFSACYERALRGASLPVAAACVGVEGGVIVASTYGVREPGTGISPWVAPLAGGLFRWSIARGVALRLDLLLAVPLVRPTFRIGGLGVIHEVDEVAVRAGGGVEIDLIPR